MGGHKPKKLIGAHRDWLIERCRAGHSTLRGLVGELAERGLKVTTARCGCSCMPRISFKETLVAAEQNRPGDTINGTVTASR